MARVIVFHQRINHEYGECLSFIYLYFLATHVYMGTVPNRSKWIRSENRTGWTFCLHGTVLELVRNGSKLIPNWKCFFAGPVSDPFLTGFRKIPCKHLNRFQTVPYQQKPIPSGSVRDGSGRFWSGRVQT